MLPGAFMPLHAGSHAAAKHPGGKEVRQHDWMHEGHAMAVTARVLLPGVGVQYASTSLAVTFVQPVSPAKLAPTPPPSPMP
jgi:hypothetical protein